VAIDRAKKPEEVDVEEVLSDLEHKVDRVKILYEQYFMGIEKLEPRTARKEITRKMLEITQMNIRNTALRYRFNALHQKFGVYTTYWTRTIREIEQGTYMRSIARAGREALRRGVDVPDEVLRTMPKLMRERIQKDRNRLAAAAEREARGRPAVGEGNSAPPERTQPAATGSDKDLDTTIDKLFDSLSQPARPVPPAAAGSTTAPPVGSYPPGMDERQMRELQWNGLPTAIQPRLFEDAVATAEAGQTAQLKERIARFLHTHKDDARGAPR
jgi:hypothetical protein